MKKNNLIYWISTGLFAAAMGLTAIPNILMNPDSVVFLNHLGFPNHFIPFIGVAKVLGSIAILIPGYPKIKEWAYAGLAFDLVGAVYSIIAVDGLQVQMAPMLVFFVLFGLSYWSHTQRSKNTAI